MFRRVNNTFGHTVGEKLLQAVAERLSETLRNTDTVAFLKVPNGGLTLSRIGTDEFAILATDLSNSDDATWIIKRIFEALSHPIDVNGQEIYTNADIGIAVYPYDGGTPEELLRNAAMARQHAKQLLGYNNFQFYSAEINEKSNARLKMESLLNRALENGELLLHYQPKMNVATGQIQSLEALLRWDNLELGMIPPNEFIPIAEQNGAICDIGEWVLRTAATQAKRWVQAGFTDISVSVNISAVQFRADKLVERIAEILDEIGLPPRHIELELTESTLMDNLDVAVDVMRRLHDIGISLSIDDFGTGYSSLSYLKRFTIDQLKIDRSFLTGLPGDPHDEAIVRAVIAMAHSMELEIVAEGVENQAQLEFLSELGCDEIQGYHFSRPVSAQEATDLIEKNRDNGPLALVADNKM